VKPGVSEALMSQVDLLASFAALVGQPLAGGQQSDSENALPALLGASTRGRTVLVEQGGTLALRQGSWKYIAPSHGPAVNKNTSIELGNDAEPQLYDLARDPGERTNLARRNPAKATELAALLAGIRRRER
jgi:arylsulfatase A-like enzyme